MIVAQSSNTFVNHITHDTTCYSCYLCCILDLYSTVTINSAIYTTQINIVNVNTIKHLAKIRLFSLSYYSIMSALAKRSHFKDRSRWEGGPKMEEE